eukprot:TRINITY_DN8527_c0_g1_i1.p1 TRINITY_DN8527_c0_g1~~TRINITY_DN8527_c0_g1_i1.p1  ORF type:complete len:165 (+),score=20.18 TRINITY_DN8527_c0_g1_i1:151-645(+)
MAPSPPSSSPAVSYDPFYRLVSLPFLALRPPRLRLKLPSFSLPSAMTVYLFVLASYFLVVSGFVYDVINAPPGIGGRMDPKTGAYVPEVFMAGRVNGQYIIEGLSSGFMFVLGGVGIIFVDWACDRSQPRSARITFALLGIFQVMAAYAMSIVFLNIKVGGYLS